jgi:hypothetical protein
MKTTSVKTNGFIPSEAIEPEIDIDVKPIMNVLIILIPFWFLLLFIQILQL